MQNQSRVRFYYYYFGAFFLFSSTFSSSLRMSKAIKARMTYGYTVRASRFYCVKKLARVTLQKQMGDL